MRNLDTCLCLTGPVCCSLARLLVFLAVCKQTQVVVLMFALLSETLFKRSSGFRKIILVLVVSKLLH